MSLVYEPTAPMASGGVVAATATFENDVDELFVPVVEHTTSIVLTSPDEVEL